MTVEDSVRRAGENTNVANAVEAVLDDEEATLSEDVVADALADPRRRVLLAYLDECEFPVPREELAEQIAAAEGGADVSTERRREIEIGLHHAHLPRLDDAGIVEYDRRSDMVVLEEERITEFL